VFEIRPAAVRTCVCEFEMAIGGWIPSPDMERGMGGGCGMPKNEISGLFSMNKVRRLDL